MNKTLAFITAAALALPLSALAQSASTAEKASTKAKSATKSSNKAASKDKVVPVKGKQHLKASAVKAVEETTPVADAVLTEGDIEVAKRVYTGKIQCELGADVTVTADDAKPGFFTVSTKGAKYRMHPVESRTGAIRLEDSGAGAMWLQLGNKSMLMNQKQGVRMADECQAAPQVAFAEEMKKNPPKALFEGADAPKK
ncbi:hypothetical protein [Pseudacidovorax sp. RU35E]|jgi:Ni/Co efflux regulator RcnB|uniref:hypothetical protein n=1 Tax=Pseudacidovorax sp. RU35E TaxID=1907403 RepID=UPI00095492EA|nr:hypothetical protein [Pseudacidovorax sp. RU35E]SIQ84785.1 hypothetical protein SAMN05880557_10668 [Pseudacidovorax sp. RU35E]